MIDWITMRLELYNPETGEYWVPRETVDKLRAAHGRIIAIDKDGTVEWESARWESVRSDSHHLAVRVTDVLTIKGSPARVGANDNTFGSSDIVECWRRMVSYVSCMLAVDLPLRVTMWKVSRVDVTQNYDLGSLSVVRQALLFLKQAEGGHYQSRSDNPESVYWNKGSRLRMGKAYAKGPHLRYATKKGKAQLPEEDIQLAERLLRLELQLGAQYWRERSPRVWYEWTADDFNDLHEDYFRPLIGNLRVRDMNETSLFKAVRDNAPSPGMGTRAWTTYCRVKLEGYRTVRHSMSPATWKRHKKILMAAGISLAQMQSSTVVPLVRHRVIELGSPVQSWDELRARAA